MAVQELRTVIDRQQWLEPMSDTLQKATSNALTGGRARQRVDDFLNGVWLGHPVHPMVTDIPIGAWTLTLALDGVETLTGRHDFSPGADAAVCIGIAGALASAATGLAQWQYTDAESRREGMAHALLNTGALALYGASAILRARGKRGLGRLAALAGFGAVALSSYLGGDLAYDLRVGINHAPGQQPPNDFTPVLAESALAEGAMKALDVGDVRLMLVRQHGQVFAIARECSHLGGPLEEGQLSDGCVTCPWHASTFTLDDGRVVNGPATFAQPVYETRVRDGQIEVRAERTAQM
ncbi:MAG TPA: Rieske 2Fe-2S domain-containing protein [Ktedonobacterales bacterium]|nr:Rieske 2Fe-2S domain-containing protein [Ktedonobacterales bacterium]